MQSEIKNCQSCQAKFIIESEDFAFYKKIDVPAPTFCPECRAVRRMAWRNERHLYKRDCITKDGVQQLISNIPPTVSFPVYAQEYWWSDDLDAMQYGQDYDFSRPFLEQFYELLQKAPQPHATNLQNSDCNYCNFTYQCKNCYLAFASDLNEDSSYLHQALSCKNSYDLEGCESMESSYMCYKSKGCYSSSYTYFTYNCVNSHLMFDCHNCQDCFGCVNLRNKKHCIFNEQYSKEEYDEKVKELRDGSYATLQKNLEKFHTFTLEFPRKYADILQSINSTGNHIRNAKNCHYCFDVADSEDCRYLTYFFSGIKDVADAFGGGVNFERGYELFSVGENAQDLYMSAMIWTCQDIYYSQLCHRSNNCFGCVSLRDKQYCILNKQYTKEEYEEMLPKIKQHMMDMPYVDNKGREYKFGEFFPVEMSPFAYNETIAQDYFPITKQDAMEKGFRWYEKEGGNYQISMHTADIPDNINDVDESILTQIVECADKDQEYSPGAFRITAGELQFYKNMNLPLPRKSPDARYYERLKQRHPLQLWKRTTEDGVDVMTSYSPDRPERILSEEAYKREVL